MHKKTDRGRLSLSESCPFFGFWGTSDGDDVKFVVGDIGRVVRRNFLWKNLND